LSACGGYKINQRLQLMEKNHHIPTISVSSE
jgi:hypothetical protein